MNFVPKLTILDNHEMDQIHQASIEILERTGVTISHDEMRDLFQQAGADVNDVSERVKIPERLVWQCVESSAKSFTLYGRNLDKQAKFGEGNRNYASSAGQAMWVDDTFTKRRYAKLDDIPLAARVADGLPMINIVGAMSDPIELPVEHRCVEVACTLLKHTVKPIHMWFYNRSTAQYLLELLIAITGSEENAAQYPITFPFLEPISPLRFPYDGIDILFETSTLSLPTPVGPMAQMGASAPGTLAGTLAQENAEILAGICVTQLIKPGLAIFYGGLPHAFDMRTAQTIFAGPEQALMAIAMVQMGKYYGLPVGVNVGLTDSKTLDAQAGLEVGTSLICGAMAGADIFGAFGISGVDQGASLVMLVMQHEIIQYVERILSGISLDIKKFGLDVVHSVGPGGNFFAEKHTVENFREELWFPELLDRQYWVNWAKEGGYTMQQRCCEMKDKILRDHVPIPLDETVAKELDKIVDAAKRHLSSKVN